MRIVGTLVPTSDFQSDALYVTVFQQLVVFSLTRVCARVCFCFFPTFSIMLQNDFSPEVVALCQTFLQFYRERHLSQLEQCHAFATFLLSELSSSKKSDSAKSDAQQLELF